MAKTSARFFVKLASGVDGPLRSMELRKLALAGEVTPQTKVALSKGTDAEFRWVSAKRVKGLFDENGKPLGNPVRPKKSPETQPGSVETPAQTGAPSNDIAHNTPVQRADASEETATDPGMPTDIPRETPAAAAAPPLPIEERTTPQEVATPAQPPIPVEERAAPQQPQEVAAPAPEDYGDSLGDQHTFDGHSAPVKSSERSLGDEPTFGGVDASSMAKHENHDDGDDLDVEVVDLSARYTIERPLGKGGMGEVLLATDKLLERQVAIKRILGDAVRSQRALNRFLNEAKSIAALNHPNIVQIYDYGRATDGPFLIMEYVAGSTLLDKCRNGALPLEEALEVTCQLCDGLGKAHDANIIHRDIKPANVLMTKTGVAKLTDFGLARDATADLGQTMAGTVLGTLDFMSPEQRKDAAAVDHRADLWSLAATLYFLVTRNSPKVIFSQAIPTALRGFLEKALWENPDDRFQDAMSFKDGALSVVAEIQEAKKQLARKQAEIDSSINQHAYQQAQCLLAELRREEDSDQGELANWISNREGTLSANLDHFAQRSHRLLPEIEGALREGQLETAQAHLQEIPPDARGEDLQRLAKITEGKIGKLASLRVEIKKQLNESRYEGLLELVTSAVEIQPHEEQWITLHQQLLERKQKQDQKQLQLKKNKIQTLLDDADEKAAAGDFKGCIAALEATLELEDNQEVHARIAEYRAEWQRMRNRYTQILRMSKAKYRPQLGQMIDEYLVVVPNDSKVLQIQSEIEAKRHRRRMYAIVPAAATAAALTLIAAVFFLNRIFGGNGPDVTAVVADLKSNTENLKTISKGVPDVTAVVADLKSNTENLKTISKGVQTDAKEINELAQDVKKSTSTQFQPVGSFGGPLGFMFASLAPERQPKEVAGAKEVIYVWSVIDGGPFDRARIKPGSLILKVNNQPASHDSLMEKIAELAEREELAFDILESGTKRTVAVTYTPYAQNGTRTTRFPGQISTLVPSFKRVLSPQVVVSGDHAIAHGHNQWWVLSASQSKILFNFKYPKSAPGDIKLSRDGTRMMSRDGKDGSDTLLMGKFVAGEAFMGCNLDDGDQGLHITNLVPDGPAEESGLLVGDVIVKIDDDSIRNENTFVSRMGEHKPGDRIPVTVRRSDQTFQIMVTLEKRSKFDKNLADDGYRHVAQYKIAAPPYASATKPPVIEEFLWQESEDRILARWKHRPFLTLFDCRTNSVVKTLPGPAGTGSLFGLDVHYTYLVGFLDRRHVLWGDDDGVTVTDIEDSRTVRSFKLELGNSNPNESLAIADYGRSFFAIKENGHIYKIDIETGTERKFTETPSSEGPLNSGRGRLTVSPDQKFLAYFQEGVKFIQVRDTQTGEKLWTTYASSADPAPSEYYPASICFTGVNNNFVVMTERMRLFAIPESVVQARPAVPPRSTLKFTKHGADNSPLASN